MFMNDKQAKLEDICNQIIALPKDFHASGSFGTDIFHAILRHTKDMNIEHSLETGCGKTTLLFSHLSNDHLVFALESTENDPGSNDSITKTFNSHLLKTSTTTLINGPTQRTMPQYTFTHKIQLALIDGPHAYPFPDLEYYYIYPLLDPGALFILDDIMLPTIHNMFKFLEADDMFTLLEVVKSTAFFKRTNSPMIDPYGEGFWLQNYNKDMITLNPKPLTFKRRVGRLLPKPLKKLIKSSKMT